MRDKFSEAGTGPGAAMSGDRVALRDELLALIDGWGLDLPSDLDDHSPLIASGLLDSLALFNLILWIETKIGHSIDPTTVDVAREWASIADILQYIHRINGASGHIDVLRPSTAARPVPESEYRIVRYDPSYKRAVAQFQTGLWSPDPELNLRYLEWKYETNPYVDVPYIYLAFHDDEIIGMRGFYASRWEAGVPARQWNVLVADDLLIREDHRNRGWVTRIMNAAYTDLRDSKSPFLFNLSGGQLTVLGSLAMGWRSTGPLKPMGRRSRGNTPWRALRIVLKRLPYLRRYGESRLPYGAAERGPFERLDRAHTPFTKKGGPAVEIDTRPRSKAMAALIERIGHDGRVRHVRDKSYFDWRFRNPHWEYRFLYVGRDSLEGYLVLKGGIARPGPSPRVSIVDLEAIGGEVQAALLEAAVRAGAFAELVIWTATANDQLLQQLYALRFEPIDQGVTASGLPCFLVRPIADERLDEEWRLGDTRLLDLKNWDIRMLFSMAG